MKNDYTLKSQHFTKYTTIKSIYALKSIYDVSHHYILSQVNTLLDIPYVKRLHSQKSELDEIYYNKITMCSQKYILYITLLYTLKSQHFIRNNMCKTTVLSKVRTLRDIL